MNRNIIFLEEVDSTNNFAHKLEPSLQKHGVAIVAENQTTGKGRLGKNWHSIDSAGLYCSIIISPDFKLDDLAKVTLISGLATAKTIEKLTGLTIGLKWPNDLFCNGKKLGGILTETLSLDAPNPILVVGIGINIKQSKEDFPEELQRKATSLKNQSGKDIDKQTLFSTLYDNLLLSITDCEKYGFTPSLQDWRKRDVLTGNTVTVVNSEKDVICGVAQGINEDGLLFVKDTRGKMHEVLSGDVQLAEK